MKLITSLASSALLMLAFSGTACGPSVSGGNGDDDTGGGGDDDGGGSVDAGDCTPSGAESTVAACSDHLDNDCDQKPDCTDPDCSGIGDCPICGEVDTSAGAGITLPDGVTGTKCTTDAQCGGATPECVEETCHASYVSVLDVVGFGANQTFDNINLIESVCVTVEHSYLRDLEIRLIAPGGQIVRLQKFQGQMGGEVYLGNANDCDEGSPSPGTGAMYCWSPTATNAPMIDYANTGANMASSPSCDGLDSIELPPGTYAAADQWSFFNGTPLNGQWKFVVTDLWPRDNGFLFDWTIKFNANAVSDCSGPIVN